MDKIVYSSILYVVNMVIFHSFVGWKIIFFGNYLWVSKCQSALSERAKGSRKMNLAFLAQSCLQKLEKQVQCSGEVFKGLAETI